MRYITMRALPNTHPGEILRDDFLTPMRLSQNAVAHAAEASLRSINEIVSAQRSISLYRG
jgi:antitoxin HigA-1